MLKFAELYCARTRLAPADFNAEVLRRCLRPHARLLRPVLEFAQPGFFDADIDFVAAVGNLTSLREFALERVNFHHHPANRSALRSLLRLRISSARLRRLAEETFTHSRDDRDNSPPAVARPKAPTTA